MENVEIVNKDFSKYEDNEKGFYFIIGTAQLLASCEYIELEEAPLKQAIFNEEIEKLDRMRFDLENFIKYGRL